MNTYSVYMLTNTHNTVLYIGITNDSTGACPSTKAA